MEENEEENKFVEGGPGLHFCGHSNGLMSVKTCALIYLYLAALTSIKLTNLLGTKSGRWTLILLNNYEVKF